MLINHTDPRHSFVASRTGKASPHEVAHRVSPSLWQYDYLVLRALRADVEALLGTVHAPTGRDSVALDVGALRSPYKMLLASRGFTVRTLDLTTEHGADYAGSAEATGCYDASIDLLLCTQVLEHTRAPWRCLREFHRIVRPGGHLLIAAPHVWFYHPHPGDYWRVTQEGIIALCEDAGFHVREVRIQGGSLMAFAQIVNFLAYGVLGGAGALLYAAVNLFGRAADAMVPNELFPLNIACLAVRASNAHRDNRRGLLRVVKQYLRAKSRIDLPSRNETGRLTTSHSPVSSGVAVPDLELHRLDRDGARIIHAALGFWPAGPALTHRAAFS